MNTLGLYAVCLAQIYASLNHWIEFYWADNHGHAEEQARDAHPEAVVLCVAMVSLRQGGAAMSTTQAAVNENDMKPHYVRHAEAVARTESIAAKLAVETDPGKRRKLKAKQRYWENQRSKLS